MTTARNLHETTTAAPPTPVLPAMVNAARAPLDSAVHYAAKIGNAVITQKGFGMDNDQLRNRIEGGYYDDIADAYMASHTGARVRFTANRRARDAFRADLEALHFADGRPSEDKLDLLFQIAWDQGHSAGYSEVVGYYDTFADLV